jgi:hypothetical protein
MIEEKKTKEVEEELRLKAEKSQSVASSSGKHRHRGSECDRPDSGFDSKDEDESKNVTLSQHQRHVSETISEEASGVTVRHHRHASATISENASSVTVRHQLTASKSVSENTSSVDGVTVRHQRHVSAAISEENGRPSSDASSSSSPDNVAEISRQAPIRQPIIRKRRIHMN